MIPYRLLGAVGVLVAVAASVVLWGDARERTGYMAGAAEVQARWNAAQRVQEQAALDDAQAARVEERRRSAEQEGIAHAAELAASAARADASHAAAAAGSLRIRATATAATACRPAASDPGAASASAPASSPGDVLVDVLSRLAVVSGQLAAVADERGAAGLACERSYDALR